MPLLPLTAIMKSKALVEGLEKQHTYSDIFLIYEMHHILDIFSISFYFQLVNIAVKGKNLSMKILLCICKILNACVYSWMRDKGGAGQGFEQLSTLLFIRCNI